MQKPAEVESFIPYQLWFVANEVSRSISAAYKNRFDLLPNEWRVLAMLANHDETGMTAYSLSGETSMDKVTVSRAVRKLVIKRLVRRYARQRDGRVSVIKVSDLGRQVYKDIMVTAKDREQEFLKLLTPVEQRWLIDIFNKLSRTMIDKRRVDVERESNHVTDPVPGPTAQKQRAVR